MKTNPPWSFNQHLSRLQELLQPNVADIAGRTLKFYDQNNVQREGTIWSVSASALLDKDQAEALFTTLCNEGRNWINLVAEGLLPDGAYLVAIEYNRQSVGSPVTNILSSGPPIGIDHTYRRDASVKIT